MICHDTIALMSQTRDQILLEVNSETLAGVPALAQGEGRQFQALAMKRWPICSKSAVFERRGLTPLLFTPEMSNDSGMYYIGQPSVDQMALFLKRSGRL